MAGRPNGLPASGDRHERALRRVEDMQDETGTAAPAPTELQADCAQCFGLCCVALPFAASADFAIDKAAGSPCRNLRTDYRCGIHTELRQRGFNGCTVYDCFGAGQKVSQVTFGGADWRSGSRGAAPG